MAGEAAGRRATVGEYAHPTGLIGAALLKGMFERAAYGCRLFCCWCARDIAANRFGEAVGEAVEVRELGQQRAVLALPAA